MNLQSLEKMNDYCWALRQESVAANKPIRLYGSEELLREMDDKVLEQISNVSRLPGLVGAAMTMPDAHWALRQRYEAEGNKRGLAMLRKISPVAWRHINFQGHFIFSDDTKTIDLDEIINKLMLITREKSAQPEISTVCG